MLHSWLAFVSVGSIFLACVRSTPSPSATPPHQASPPAVAAWAARAFDDIQVEPDLVYRTVDGRALALDLYRVKASAPRPTVLYIHGGAWRHGSKDAETLAALPWLAHGWNVALVDYRLADVALAPAAVEDCRCALRWLSAHAEDHGVDRDHLIVSGASAGGHLALVAGMATTADGFDHDCPGPELPVAAIVNWYGFADLSAVLAEDPGNARVVGWLGRDRADDRAWVARLSPASHVRAGLPPIISVQNVRDANHPYLHTVRLHQALDAAGVANWLVSVRSGDGQVDASDRITGYTSVFELLASRGVR